MKSTLLFLFFILAQHVSAQKTLLSTTHHQFGDPANSVPDYYDSTFNIYSIGNGDIASNKPVFSYYPSLFNYQFGGLEDIQFDVQEQYNGNSYPLSQGLSTTNTYSQNQLIQTEFDNHKRLYSYDTAGNIVKEIGQMSSNGTWSVVDSTLYTYSSSGELLTKTRFDPDSGGSSIIVYSNSDSSFFDPNSGNVIEVRGHYFDFISGNVYTNYKREFHYTATGLLDFVDVYVFNYPLEILEWNQRVYYSFQNDLPTTIETFAVVSGTIEPTPINESFFEYDQFDNLIRQTSLQYGDTLLVDHYYYVDSEFLDRIESIPPSNSTLLTDFHTYFHYDDESLHLTDKTELVVSLSPNPTHDFISFPKDQKVSGLKIYDINGQVIMEQSSGTLDVRHLPSGAYFVQGATSKGWFNEKFIKL